MTRIPAARQLTMESNTSVLGGSNIPTQPTKVMLVSYSMNLRESSRSMSSTLGGLSMVARAKQRRVSRPVPHSLQTFKISFLTAGVMGPFLYQHGQMCNDQEAPQGHPWQTFWFLPWMVCWEQCRRSWIYDHGRTQG